jgi:hypothetical protein
MQAIHLQLGQRSTHRRQVSIYNVLVAEVVTGVCPQVTNQKAAKMITKAERCGKCKRLNSYFGT